MTKPNWKIEQGSRGNLKRRFFFDLGIMLLCPEARSEHTVSTVIPRSMVGRGPKHLGASETTKQASSCHSIHCHCLKTSKHNSHSEHCPLKQAGKKNLTTTTTCLADKTNHPVERLSLNRSQCGSCSTKYDTSAGT